MTLSLFRRLVTAAKLSLLSSSALALQAGLSQMELPGAPSTTVALYYPTKDLARPMTMGPYTLNVAIRGEPERQVKGLILLSHGTGGSELGHSSLAEALARSGYLVAALRHPGDNWQDTSLLTNDPSRYFVERPRQASRVIDALLSDPAWKDRIARDAQGPRVGAVGHSAGGYTVLALAGARADLARIGAHCQANAAADPIFCGMGRARLASAGLGLDVADRRVRALVAMSPVGVTLTADSLASFKLPVRIYVAELDRFLVPKFHTDWVASKLPGADIRRVPNAGHFAFMDKPKWPLPTADGDVGADPEGFDRAAFLWQLAEQLPAFFDQAWR